MKVSIEPYHRSALKRPDLSPEEKNGVRNAIYAPGVKTI